MVDAALVGRRFEALYVADARGRLKTSNEWDARTAPRFHLMATPHGPLWRCRADTPDTLAERLGALARAESWTPEPGALPANHARFLDILGPVERIWTGPAFAAAGDLPATPGAVPVDEANTAVLEPLLPEWLADVPHRRPFVAVVKDGAAVALCASVRISPFVHCAGVETHPDHRRRGHALTAVAAWARAVRALGATPFYSTSWDNAGSRAIAARLGFTHVACDYHLT